MTHDRRAVLPPGVCVWLEAPRHEAEHLVDLNLLTATDTQIWLLSLSLSPDFHRDSQNSASRSVSINGQLLILWSKGSK
jgi:hypothetical protein